MALCLWDLSIGHWSIGQASPSAWCLVAGAWRSCSLGQDSCALGECNESQVMFQDTLDRSREQSALPSSLNIYVCTFRCVSTDAPITNNEFAIRDCWFARGAFHSARLALRCDVRS